MDKLMARLRQLMEYYPHDAHRAGIAANVLVGIDIISRNNYPSSSNSQNALTYMSQNFSENALDKGLHKYNILNKEGDLYDQLRKILNTRASKDTDFYNLLSHFYEIEHWHSLQAWLIEHSGNYLEVISDLDALKDKVESDGIARAIINRSLREQMAPRLDLLSKLSNVKISSPDIYTTLIDQLAEGYSSPSNPSLQQRTNSTVRVLKEKNTLSSEHLTQIADVVIRKIYGQAFDNIVSTYRDTLHVLATYPLNDDSKARLADILLSKSPKAIIGENSTETTDLLKTAQIKYKDNTAAFEKFYNELRATENSDLKRAHARRLLESGALSRESSEEKDYYARIDNLT